MRRIVRIEQEKSIVSLLTELSSCYCYVVPHVGFPVQWFGQCDLPIVHIDVELPL